MNCLSRTAASAATIVMLLMARPSPAADDQVHLHPFVPNTTFVAGSPAAQGDLSTVRGHSSWRPHRYAIFWRGYCLCESMCWEAKVQRYRYPDYLRHQRYVATQHASGSYGLPVGQLAPHCDHCGPPSVSLGWRGWLPNVLSFGRRGIVSVPDTVVANGPNTFSRTQIAGHGEQNLTLAKQSDTGQAHETGAPIASGAAGQDSDAGATRDIGDDFPPDAIDHVDDSMSPEPLDASRSDQPQRPIVLSSPNRDEPSQAVGSPGRPGTYVSFHRLFE